MESHDETVQRLEREKAARDREKQRMQTVTAIEEATTITFRALNQLILRGYRPELGKKNFCDAIFMHHPARKAKFPNLILYPGGYIVGPPKGPGGKELCILLEDAREFDGFLRTVPLPNWWERTREARATVVAWIVIQLPFYLIAAWGVMELIG
jgi:hypothetical protein